MPRNITVEAVEGGITLEMTREGMFNVRNAVASAALDGRHDRDDAFSLRAKIPEPTPETTGATVEVERPYADRLYHAFREAEKVARADGRDATARRIDRQADRIAFALGQESNLIAE